jgi:hypothetical protein
MTDITRILFQTESGDLNAVGQLPSLIRGEWRRFSFTAWRAERTLRVIVYRSRNWSW